ncbi:hypothetical protein BST61_g7554 [Cercospora zeina]
MAVVSGANLLLNPDNLIAMSCLGLLGQTGKSYSFDQRAEGYGRGEGVVTLILKPLSIACRDGDNIRAVIKNTLVNQDGRTPTITSPSVEAQEDLIRRCYSAVGLDPIQTAYCEVHGTGTKVGDPIELEALRRTLVTGDRQSQLYVGSVKSNIGRLEAASGLVAVVKVALALEKGLIPPNANFEDGKGNVSVNDPRMVIATDMVPWPKDGIRRASVNNFGYGGSNAHLVMEAFDKTSSHNTSLSCLENRRTESQHVPASKVIILSAGDETALQRMALDLADYLDAPERHQNGPEFLNNMCFTLSERRKRFSHITACSGSSAETLSHELRRSNSHSDYAAQKPRIGFVFNVQGAQWWAMGRGLIDAYPVFFESLKNAATVSKRFGASWDLLEELRAGEKASRVNEPEMSLCLCTALQLALVDLLRSWSILPDAVVSHSSGEAAAAYAADALSFTSALAVPYFRGTLNSSYQSKLQLKGGMLAVGLGPTEVATYLEKLQSGKAVLACVNSPSSVTLSGDIQSIFEIAARLSKDNVFHRRLKVGAAYHSHHMLPQPQEYYDALSQNFESRSVGNNNSSAKYFSPVSGTLVLDKEQLGRPQHWVDNMTKPVIFSPAFSSMCYNDGSSKSLDIVLEIGPHGALAGPIRQTFEAGGHPSGDFSYISCLTRDKHAVETSHSMVCKLLSRGFPVTLSEVNLISGKTELRVLQDLPSYPWNHSVSYWTESRVNREHRVRPYPSHDLLGSWRTGSSDNSLTWRNFISQSTLPWLRDHKIQSQTIFPAAGFISMAIQAFQQVMEENPFDIILLRDVYFHRALEVSEAAPGTEVQTHLRKSHSSKHNVNEWSFLIESMDGLGTWQKHCSGAICTSSDRNAGPLLKKLELHPPTDHTSIRIEAKL